MRRSIVKWFALFLLGFLPFYSVACSNQQANKSSAAPVAKPLIVGTEPWAGFQGHYVAVAKDYFGAEGIKIQDEPFQTVSDTNTALLARRIDLAWIGAPDLVNLAAQNPALKAIMTSDYSNGADGIMARNISKPEDLKGKKIAREEAPYEVVFLGEYLKKSGLTEKDVQIIPLAAADAAVAFASGKVDAALTYEPYLSKAVKQGKGEIIFTTKGTNIIPNILVSSSQVLQERRPEVLAYMRAVGKGVNFTKSNPQEADKIIAKDIGVKPEEIPAQLAGIRVMDIEGNKTIAFNANHSLALVKSLEAATETLKSLGKTRNPNPVNASVLIDDSLIKSL